MKNKTYDLVLFSMLLAILIIFAFTPLGSIPIGPIVATLAMIPVIIATLCLGLKAGMLMGFFFGLLSLIYFTVYNPGPYSFLFTPFVEFGGMRGNIFSLVLCFGPRIMIAVTTHYTKNLLDKLQNNHYLSTILASIVGSLTNTALFLLGAIIFFNKEFVGGVSIWAILYSTLLINGSAEAIISAIVSPVVYQTYTKILKGKR